MLLAYSSLIMISEYDFFHLIPFIQSNIYTYFGFIIIVTFGYLYYRGPFSTPKAFKIIELILKGISFIIFYFGISNKEIALGIFGIIVFGKYLLKLLIKIYALIKNIRFVTFLIHLCFRYKFF